MGAILDIGTDEFNNSKSPYHPNASPLNLGSIQLIVWEQMWFEDFQDGHCGGILDIGTKQF